MPKKSKRRRICDRCGLENAPTATECSDCGSGRFAPPWVLALRPINRQVSVQITETNPAYGDVTPRVTLYKWWPGNRATFHIPTAGQWKAIERIINEDLAPHLGWRTKTEILKTVRLRQRAEASAGEQLQGLVKDYPDSLRELVEALDPSKLGRDNLEQVIAVMQELVDAIGRFDTGFTTAFLNVVKNLPQQKQRALEDLEALLASWSLQQITSVAQQVKTRLATIELLKEQIKDERTYEIRGDNSIHRILERAMWLVDERYWLLQSNATLRTFIGDEMSREDRARYGKQRPDFLCGTVGEKLIVLELKRPKHTLEVEDLNQLETYVTLAEKYSTFSNYEAYLVGQRISDDLKSRKKHRSNSFRVWTYTDLLSSAEARYRKFIEKID